MNGKFMVLGEKTETANFKSGPKNFVLLNLLDMGKPRMTNTIDYQLSDAEISSVAGKLTDQNVEVGFTDLATAFGGRLRGRGEILTVNGKPVAQFAKPA